MPRCPPPLADELLSSWLKRLARANYCTEDELCRYLGLRSGRAPETLADLAGVDVAGLCSILRLVRDDLVAMLIVEHHNFPKGFSLCFRSHQMLIGLLRSRHGSWTVPGDVRELLDLGKLVSSAVRQAGGPALGPD